MSDEAIRALLGQVRAMKEQVACLALQAEAFERQILALAVTMARSDPASAGVGKPRQRHYMMGDTDTGPPRTSSDESSITTHAGD